MEFYDMHSHILPDFDDGAKDVETALELIDILRNQGVRNICLTPHFYTDEISYDKYLEERQIAFEKFKPFIPPDVNIVLGSEVYITDYLFNNNDLSGITYGNSRYILTEFPYKITLTEQELKQFYMLTQNYGLHPVIPHVERYDYLISHPETIEQLQEIGVMIQTNISRYANNVPAFKRRKLLKFISKGLIDIIGSDSHSLTHSPPSVYNEAIENITKKCGEHAVERMMKKSAMIFRKALGEPKK